MSFLDYLPDHYRIILCDLWGCVHNGIAILPGVIDRLDRWKSEHRRVVFLTNAPRPSSAVSEQLARLGMPDRLNGTVVSSGDVGLAWIKAEPRSRNYAFIGSSNDAARLKSCDIRLVPDKSADGVICTGFDESGFDVFNYIPRLRRLAEREADMLCFNPDRVVHRGNTAEPCAGAIAEAYAKTGGRVRQFGKPYREIYDHAAGVVGCPARDAMLAIGDSIATDFVGATNANIDFVFVAGGIDAATYQTHSDRAFGRMTDQGRTSTGPIAIVPTLG